MSGSVQDVRQRGLRECVRTRRREVGNRMFLEHEIALSEITTFLVTGL